MLEVEVFEDASGYRFAARSGLCPLSDLQGPRCGGRPLVRFRAMSLPQDMNLAWSDPVLQRAVETLGGGDPGTARDLLAATTDPDRRELYAKCSARLASCCSRSCVSW